MFLEITLRIRNALWNEQTTIKQGQEEEQQIGLKMAYFKTNKLTCPSESIRDI